MPSGNLQKTNKALPKMKIINILTVCASEEERTALSNQFRKLPFISNCKFAASWGEAILEMNVDFPDMVLVDSSIVSFLDIATLYTAIPREALPLIVISNQAYDAIESYNTGIPVDFLLKPFQPERLEMAIIRAISHSISSKRDMDQDSIFLKVGRVYTKFFFDDIVYVEGYGIYSKIMTPRGKITINDSIMSLGEKLSPKRFVRVHKSFIINTSKVVALKSNTLEMEIGEVPIGAHFKSSIEGFLNIIKKNDLISKKQSGRSE
jgi:CheY-like chemotaxis protein